MPRPYVSLRHRVLVTVIFLCALYLPAISSHAAEPSVERTGALTAAGVPDAVPQALDPEGYRVTFADGTTADLWVVRSLAANTADAAGALYPHLANGAFVAAITFPKGTSDYRGQAIATGTYTLRYQYIPQDANHMGVSPNPDFLLALPVASDTNPADALPLKRLVSLSTKASATAHPAVFALAPAGDTGHISKDDQGMTVLTVEIPTSGAGKTEKIGIILKGQAAQ